MTDNGEHWDATRDYPTVRQVAFERLDSDFRRDNPSMQFSWTGPTNPQEARACDAVMVELGEFLARRQAAKRYAFHRITDAMRGIRKG